MLICGTIVRYVISNQLIASSAISLNSYLRDEICLIDKNEIALQTEEKKFNYKNYMICSDSEWSLK